MYNSLKYALNVVFAYAVQNEPLSYVYAPHFGVVFQVLVYAIRHNAVFGFLRAMQPFTIPPVL